MFINALVVILFIFSRLEEQFPRFVFYLRVLCHIASCLGMLQLARPKITNWSLIMLHSEICRRLMACLSTSGLTYDNCSCSHVSIVFLFKQCILMLIFLLASRGIKFTDLIRERHRCFCCHIRSTYLKLAFILICFLNYCLIFILRVKLDSLTLYIMKI